MSFIKRFQNSMESLYQLPDNAHYVVAYSGGLDSHVLLYCCKQLKLPVRAVHVHHGLQSIADEWVEHCRSVCESLGVELDVIYVEVQKQRGQSPEEAARNARYRALKDSMQINDCLLTAQHRNDQAETLLLQLFRTASSAGLSAMPSYRKWGGYIHLRPMLTFSRNEIENYARDNALQWIEDPSNQDVSYDRNFIRKNLVPLLETRWPNITQQLSTVAGLQSNNLQVLQDMAAIDLANAIKVPDYQCDISIYKVVSILSVSALKKLSSARLLNLLRYWLIQAAELDAAFDMAMPSPTRKLLEEAGSTLIASRRDARPVIAYAGYELRKYQDGLYLLKPGPIKPDLQQQDWNPAQPLTIPALGAQLSVVNTAGKGLQQALLNKPLTIRFREGGEHFHPVGRQHSNTLKKLFQEASVPPWLRGNIPLLYCGQELIAVIGLWYSKQHTTGETEEGWMVDIKQL